MEEDGPQEAAIDFVSAVCFVPRGKSKARPEKVILTQSELARIIQSTKECLASEDDDNDDSENEGNMQVDEEEPTSNNQDDEFNFERYEQETETQVAAISDIVEPEEQLPDEDDDSEAEDEIIKPTDNLVLVGPVQDDAASLEVWVYNPEERSLYTHHDFLLPSFPLCIEWLSHDPGSEETGNMCAIGCMDPIITIWDLDIQDSLEATFKLGSKGSRRKQKEAYGHTNAVLDLSWNRQYEHILASGSVDQTLILWDLDEGAPHTTITAFEEKVQSIEFHPEEAQTLLTGCADGLVRLFDCRDPTTIDTSFVKWNLPDNVEVEKVLWNPNSNNYFAIGANDGSMYYADKRQPDTLLWTYQAHEKEISGICFNSQAPNMLCSSAIDGTFKVHNFSSSSIKEVFSTDDFAMGQLQCMKQCPDDPFVLAFGGSKPPRCRIFNIKNYDVVRQVFNIPDENE